MTLAKHLAVGSRYGKRGGWHLPTRRYEASTPQEWTISARLVQTCNLTYCPHGDFRHDCRRRQAQRVAPLGVRRYSAARREPETAPGAPPCINE